MYSLYKCKFADSLEVQHGTSWQRTLWRSEKNNCCSTSEVLNSSPRAPPAQHILHVSLLTHLIQIISLLEVRSMHELCSDWHAPYTGSIAPYSLSRGNPLKFTSFRNIHSWICSAQRLHPRTSVTYTSVNIYNFNPRLAHLYALWMEYMRSLRTGIMAEYPVMSTSQGSCVRIEQTSEAIRVTQNIQSGGARGLELRTAALHKDGVGYNKMTKILKLSSSTVAKTIQRFNRTGSTQNSPWHGLPKKLSARAQCHIQRLCLGNRCYLLCGKCCQHCCRGWRGGGSACQCSDHTPQTASNWSAWLSSQKEASSKDDAQESPQTACWRQAD